MALPPWFMDSARALIRADSVSAQGNQAALAVLEPLYVKAGLSTQRFSWRESIDGAPDSLHSNLLAGPGGGHAQGAMGGVLFVTHSDTVPTGPLERWTETGGDPRALTEKDGWLFGLGVADVKLDALCKIAAAERLLGKKLARPFWLCATAAEEVGLRGARRFAESAEFKALRRAERAAADPRPQRLRGGRLHHHRFEPAPGREAGRPRACVRGKGGPLEHAAPRRQCDPPGAAVGA